MYLVIRNRFSVNVFCFQWAFLNLQIGYRAKNGLQSGLTGATSGIAGIDTQTVSQPLYKVQIYILIIAFVLPKLVKSPSLPNLETLQSVQLQSWQC